jgi:hypothetical protein
MIVKLTYWIFVVFYFYVGFIAGIWAGSWISIEIGSIMGLIGGIAAVVYRDKPWDAMVNFLIRKGIIYRTDLPKGKRQESEHKQAKKELLKLNADDFIIGNAIDILYKNKQGDITQRQIIINSITDKYIKAFCTVAGAERTFRLDRILNLQSNTDNFKKYLNNATDVIVNNFEKHMSDRKQNEFLGILKGIISDGVIEKSEIKYIKEWIIDNKMQHLFPAQEIYASITQAKGNYDSEFDGSFLELVINTVGIKTKRGAIESSNKQALTTPRPKIEFNNKNFIVTGTCKIKNPITDKHHLRNDIHNLIKHMGGNPQKNLAGNIEKSVNSETNYLVICSFSSNNWAHSNYGRKIEEAQEYPYIKIIDDNHLLEVINDS